MTPDVPPANKRPRVVGLKSKQKVLVNLTKAAATDCATFPKGSGQESPALHFSKWLPSAEQMAKVPKLPKFASLPPICNIVKVLLGEGFALTPFESVKPVQNLFCRGALDSDDMEYINTQKVCCQRDE